MNDISELERRILYALERIGRGVEGIDGMAIGGHAAVSAEPHDAAGSELIAALRTELEAERSANAQLTERVRAIKDKQETMVASLEKKVARLTQQLDGAEVELQRHRRLNADLVAANQSLSAAAMGGSLPADTLNRSLMTELEAMRAARAGEMAEMEEIMAELKPLIGEVA